jgi:hypothetical protein
MHYTLNEKCYRCKDAKGKSKGGKKETQEKGNAKAQRRKDAKGKKRKERKGIRKKEEEEEEEELGRRCPKREKAAIRDTDTYQLKVHPEPTNFSSRSPPPTLPFPSLPYPSLPFPSLPFPSLPFPSLFLFLFLFLFPLRPCAFAPLRSLLFLPAFTVCADQTLIASKNEFCRRLA